MSAEIMHILLAILLYSSVSLVRTQESLPTKLPSSTTDQCPQAPAGMVSEEAVESYNSQVTQKYGLPLDLPCKCGGNGYWKKVVDLNMNDSSTQCPSSDWTLIETPVRGCRARIAGCNSAIFSTERFSYNRVCGRMVGYQKGSIQAFTGVLNIEGIYVEGLSLTHGFRGSRQHIWTFVAALYDEDPAYSTRANCECTNINYFWTFQIPSFVGDNYFCDTGNPGPGWEFPRVYVEDPLWDGKGCGQSSTCCWLHNPPWFCATLPELTDDDLELRICHDQSYVDEGVVVSEVELYVSRD